MNTQTEHTKESELFTYAVESVSEQLKAYRLQFRRRILQKILDEIDPKEEREQDDEEGIDAVLQSQEPGIQNEGPRLLLSKARGELRPLVRFLAGCTFREKLAGVAMDILSYGDIEAALGDWNLHLYDGEIGSDLTHDWRTDVFRSVGEETGTPEERALSAYLAGLSAAK